MDIQEFFEEYGFNMDELATIWKWLEENEIYGIWFEGVEFEPDYHNLSISWDKDSNFDVDKIYLKTFKGEFRLYSLREVFNLLKLEYD